MVPIHSHMMPDNIHQTVMVMYLGNSRGQPLGVRGPTRTPTHTTPAPIHPRVRVIPTGVGVPTLHGFTPGWGTFALTHTVQYIGDIILLFTIHSSYIRRHRLRPAGMMSCCHCCRIILPLSPLSPSCCGICHGHDVVIAFIVLASSLSAPLSLCRCRWHCHRRCRAGTGAGEAKWGHRR